MAMNLCVDDEPAVSAVSKHALTRLGHRCRRCSSVEEALEAVARSSFDLILADYKMPKKTGLDLRPALHHRHTGPILKPSPRGISTCPTRLTLRSS
jgi:CheY-like chemotaxis protein